MSLIRFYFQMRKILHSGGRILRGGTLRRCDTMLHMDLVTAPAAPASARHSARAQRMVRVKFVGMPVRETEPEAACGEMRASGGAVSRFLSRVFGRLAAARP